MVMRDLLVRGMLAGFLAATLAIGFAYVVGEPQINNAIAFEDRLHADSGTPPEPELVRRNMQSTAGLATGIGVLGVAFGGVFAVAFALGNGRLGTLGARGTALTVALVGFTAFYLVPFLKYPANPPSAGEADTIARRTVLYFGMLLISVVATTGAVILQRRLAAHGSNWNAAIIAGVAFLLIVTAALVLMPGINEVPAEFPAVVLWRFRVASLGMQLVLWVSMGLIFGGLSERAVRSRAHDLARFPRAGAR